MHLNVWLALRGIWRTRMSWFRRGSEEEDEVVAEAGALMLDGLSDADTVRSIEMEHGRNIRNQMTVEEAEEIYEEVRLRRYGWGRN